MRIFKYEVEPGKPVTMKRGAKVMSAAAIGDSIFVWAIVDELAPDTARRIVGFPTGLSDVSEAKSMVFIGTVVMHGGALVFHIFDGGEAG